MPPSFGSFGLSGLSGAAIPSPAVERYSPAHAVPWVFGEYLMDFVRLGRGLPDELSAGTVEPLIHREFGEFESAEPALAALRSWHGSEDSADHNAKMAVAAWAAYYGDHDLALSAVRASTRLRAQNLWFLWLPVFEDMRREQGFEDLLRELGLADYWETYGWPPLCRPLGGEDFECGARR